MDDGRPPPNRPWRPDCWGKLHRSELCLYLLCDSSSRLQGSIPGLSPCRDDGATSWVFGGYTTQSLVWGRHPILLFCMCLSCCLSTIEKQTNKSHCYFSIECSKHPMKNQLTTNVKVCFWTSILFYWLIRHFMLSWLLWFCSKFQNWEESPPTFFFFFSQDCFGDVGFLAFPYEFQVLLFNFYKTKTKQNEILTNLHWICRST